MRRFIIAALVVIIAATIIVAWQARKRPVTAVNAVTVEQGPLSAYVIAVGTVVTRQEANINSQTSGEVRRLETLQGAAVKRGDLLLRLDDRQATSVLRKAEAAAAQLREEGDKIRRDLEASKRLLSFGGVAPQEVMDLESQLNIAQAKATQQEQELELARQELEKMTLRAPFAGMVASVNAQVGEWVTPNKPLFRLADMSKLEVEARVDASDAGAVTLKQSAVITSEAFPGKVWRGTVREIAPAVENSEGAKKLLVRIQPRMENFVLRLGQQVDIKIETAVRDRALKLPFSALIEKDGKSWVASIREGRARLLPVSTGISDLTHIEIVEGVNAGQRVILYEGKSIKEGDPVREAGPVPVK